MALGILTYHGTREFRLVSMIALVFMLSFHSHQFTFAADASEDDRNQTINYLKDLSIEKLLEVKITSVSKKKEALFTAAAAATVITQEDIKRAGVTSIPEALRLVPGMEVAQINSSRWAISARGFNDFFANKLLVLIDGRSVYTPLYSGVFWNAQDTMLEDIDRIEVIRGPGATIWGANAVNGVINIITKNSMDTQGVLASAIVGDHIQPLISARYGGKFREDTSYRFFVKGFRNESFDNPSGQDNNDDWDSYRGGFRMDSTPSSTDTLSLQAEIYDGSADATITLGTGNIGRASTIQEGTEDFNGGHILLDWQHQLSALSKTNFQLYYDHTERDLIVAEETRDTVDIEFKHLWNPPGRHDIVWGAGYHFTTDDITNTDSVSFNPDNRSDDVWSAFIQDDIFIVEDTAWFTIGSKFEHNDYSGFEVQPSIRFRLIPSENNFLWAAVSRAVRTPSRFDHDVTNDVIISAGPSGIPGRLRLLGNDSFDSETLIAYELGYRFQTQKKLSVDLAVYYNDYDDLRETVSGMPFIDMSSGQPVFVIPTEFQNKLEAESYGFELLANWQVSKMLKIIAGYSYLHLDVKNAETAGRGISLDTETLSPKHQFKLRSYLNLPMNFSFDSELYYVSELEQQDIDSYIRLDLQLSWQPKENLIVSISGENLLESEHQEFPSRQFFVVSEIPRQFWLKATYSF